MKLPANAPHLVSQHIASKRVKLPEQWMPKRVFQNEEQYTSLATARTILPMLFNTVRPTKQREGWPFKTIIDDTRAVVRKQPLRHTETTQTMSEKPPLQRHTETPRTHLNRQAERQTDTALQDIPSEC